MDPALVSVLIPTRNNVAELRACIDSLRSSRHPVNRMELLLFDNGSRDDAAAAIETLVASRASQGWARVALARSARNLGAFGGRAVAARQLAPAGEYVLSLDDDVEVEPDAIGHLLAAMRDTRVAAVGARIVYHDAPDVVASGAGDFDRWLGIYRERAPGVRTECDFVSSCGSLFRRSAFDEAGGFDGQFYTSHGDVDLCLTLRARGRVVCWEPAATIRHKVDRGGTRTPERVYYGYRNKLLVLRKHVPTWWRAVPYVLYAALWPPALIAGSIRHHGRVNRAELRAIMLALLDAARDRRGEAPWFR